jgi:hypothetical protein
VVDSIDAAKFGSPQFSITNPLVRMGKWRNALQDVCIEVLYVDRWQFLMHRRWLQSPVGL